MVRYYRGPDGAEMVEWEGSGNTWVWMRSEWLKPWATGCSHTADLEVILETAGRHQPDFGQWDLYGPTGRRLARMALCGWCHGLGLRCLSCGETGIALGITWDAETIQVTGWATTTGDMIRQARARRRQ